MEKFLEKLSSYNILNNILPGVIVMCIYEFIYQSKLLDNDPLKNLFIYYFVGLIVSRIGSVLIEPIVKKIKLVEYAQYNDYLSATAKDKKIDTLLETNNVYRTFLGVSLISGLMALHSYVFIRILELNNTITIAIIILGLSVLFAFSYNKQSKYIVKRINKANERDSYNEHN